MAQNNKAIGYLDLNIKGFQEALKVASTALAVFTASFAALKTIEFWKDGIADAIKFGDAAYLAAQRLNAIDPGKLYLVQKALEQGGLSAQEAQSKIQEYANNGMSLDQLFRGGKDAEGSAMARVIQEYGTQAQVLTNSAEKFSAIQDRLNSVGEKLRGFFLGMVDGISTPLMNLINMLDQVDLVSMGKEFGDAISAAVATLYGLITNQNLFKVLGLALSIGVTDAGIALLKMFGNVGHFLSTVFGEVFQNLGSGLSQIFLGIAGLFGVALLEAVQPVLKIVVDALAYACTEAGQALYAAFQHPLQYLEDYMAFSAKNFGAVLSTAISIAMNAILSVLTAFEAVVKKFWNAGDAALYGSSVDDAKKANSDAVAQAPAAVTPDFKPTYESFSQYQEQNKGNDKLFYGNSVDDLRGKAAQVLGDGFKTLGKDVQIPGLTIANQADRDELSKLLKDGFTLGNAQLTKTAPFQKNTVIPGINDPRSVIADSLAKVGGGGRFARTGLSAAEKAQLETAKATTFLADAVRAQQQAGKAMGAVGAGVAMSLGF